jgi:hypothetical protein
MFDWRTEPLEADLSRADVSVLHEFCAGKFVVEFGAGGSTKLLRKFSARVMTFETDARWVRETKKRVPGADVRLCSTKVPDIPRCDVLFIDGLCALRAAWMRASIDKHVAPIILAHDTRRREPVKGFTALLEWPCTGWLDSVQFHYRESNMLVVRLRDKRVQYENWNATEPQHRLAHWKV